jgi:hypothetical protein
MNIKLENIQRLVEVNSCYVEGELSNKFKKFVKALDSLGISSNGVKIGLDKKETASEEVGDIIEAQTDEKDNGEIPSVWVLVDDSDVFPIFEPMKTDANGTDYDKALISHGLDILVLRTAFTDKQRIFKVIVDGELLEKRGTLRDIQAFIINNFEHQQNRTELLKKLAECEKDPMAISSFFMEIPAHSVHVVLGVDIA